MSQQDIISLTSFCDLIDNISASLAKSKAMAAIAVSTELAEYKSEIASDYLNALFQFIEEGYASLLELQNHFFKLINAKENRINNVK